MTSDERGLIPARERRAQGNVRRTWMFLGGVLVALAAGACNESLSVPPAAKVASIAVLAGDGQAGIVGTTALNALSVFVKDQRGMPMAGAEVSFWTNNGGRFSAPTVPSDSTGAATVLYTFGDVAGPTKVFAAVSGVADTLTFTLQANPGAPNALRELVASADTAAVGTPLPTPLTVRLVDIFGNAIVGATVTWSANGGAVLSSPTSITDANGQAQVQVTLPPNAGVESVIAHVDGVLDAVFTVIAQ
jgi:hypothetical protein